MSDKLPACRGLDGTSRGVNDKLAACRTAARRAVHRFGASPRDL